MLHDGGVGRRLPQGTGGRGYCITIGCGGILVHGEWAVYIPTRVKNDIHYERRDGSLKEERVCVDYKCAKRVTISTHTNTHTHTHYLYALIRIHVMSMRCAKRLN